MGGRDLKVVFDVMADTPDLCDANDNIANTPPSSRRSARRPRPAPLQTIANANPCRQRKGSLRSYRKNTTPQQTFRSAGDAQSLTNENTISSRAVRQPAMRPITIVFCHKWISRGQK